MQVPPMGPLSTTAVVKPFSTAADATIIPEPVPITRTSKLSIAINSNKDAQRKQINLSPRSPNRSAGKSFMYIPEISIVGLIMSEEKKKEIYYKKKEKTAKEVKAKEKKPKKPKKVKKK